VDAPHWQDDLMPPERSIPGKRMLVVGVDQRAIDVEHSDCHGRGSTRSAVQKTLVRDASACESAPLGTMYQL
jgi:hypothetical protein